jgi:ArsR family transcriptional regulator
MDTIEQLADVFKAMADPTRLRLVKILSSDQPLCVNALTRKLDITQSAVSQHLRILKQAGLVKGQRKGSFIHYSLNHSQWEAHKKRLTRVLGEDF